MKTISLVILLFINSLTLFSQNRKKADQYFIAGNFESALEEYSGLVEKYPEDLLFNYRLAVCYLNTNIDHKEPVRLLEFVVQNELADPNALFLLGRAYHFNEQYDKAIETYQKFAAKGLGSQANLAATGKQIEFCQNAKELIKYPIKLKIENLGSNINTSGPEFYPFLPSDESYLFFNARRNDGSGIKKNGTFYSNIYYAKIDNSNFSKAKKLETFNTSSMDEYIVGMNNKGDVAVVVYEDQSGYNDLNFLTKQNDKFGNLKKLNENVNTKYSEIAASINDDSTAIYFASDRPGGYGGIDLYVSRRLPNGEWSKAQNLGPGVNTIYDEDFPSISPDGTTLFFSSKGHTSMGGYDIFKAEFNADKNSFMTTRNVGYPLNTPYDDMNFRISDNGKYGYISSFRPGGFGDFDIYRVTFEEVEAEFTIVKGFIHDASDSLKRPEAAFVTVSNKENGELYGEYQPNNATGRYVMILPPGKYLLFIEAIGYAAFELEVEVKGHDQFVFEKELDLFLKPE